VRLERLTPRPRRIDELEDELAGLGFAAQVSKELIELEACPCPVVSPERPTVVCALVAGAVDGTLERTGSGMQVIDAEHDPAARRCTLFLGPTM
jgi:predicted ArsR family transcriptional regulator